MTLHKIKIATKPDKDAYSGSWGIIAATAKATKAILHQGRYIPATKLTSAINNIDIKNFIFASLDLLYVTVFSHQRSAISYRPSHRLWPTTDSNLLFVIMLNLKLKLITIQEQASAIRKTILQYFLLIADG